MSGPAVVSSGIVCSSGKRATVYWFIAGLFILLYIVLFFAWRNLWYFAYVAASGLKQSETQEVLLSVSRPAVEKPLGRVVAYNTTSNRAVGYNTTSTWISRCGCTLSSRFSIRVFSCLAAKLTGRQLCQADYPNCITYLLLICCPIVLILHCLVLYCTAVCPVLQFVLSSPHTPVSSPVTLAFEFQ